MDGKGLSKNSLYSYGRDLKIFSEWLETKKINLLNASRRDIQMFLSYRFEQGLSARTTARQLSCLRNFYRHCLREKNIKSDPSILIDNPK